MIATTTRPNSMRSRRQNRRPASRRVSRKLASGFLASRPGPRTRFVALQVAERAPGCAWFSYENASGCVVAPNNKQLSKSDCDSLASKINNNVAGLDRIATSQGENLNGGAVGALRSMWDAVGYPAELTGYAEEGYEMSYRFAKTGLDLAGNREWRKAVTSGYKSVANFKVAGIPVVNALGKTLTAIDVIQLGVDINDRDGAMFISHSAEMALNFTEGIPGINAVVLGSRFVIRDQLRRLENNVAAMDASGIAAYNQEMSRNVLVGTRNVNQWQKEWNDGGCARFKK